MQRRLVVGGLPALFAATRGLAQDAASASSAGRRYVAMSLVSDKLSMVEKLGHVSDPTQDRARTIEVPLTGSPFDAAALTAIAAALAVAEPAARASFLATSSPEFYTDQDAWFEDDTVKLPPKLRQAIDGERADRLLLLTKWQGEAIVFDGKSNVGRGKLAGLGFYRFARREGVDRDNTDVTLYVAPFIYTQLALVDLATSRLVRSRVVREAKPYPALTLTTEHQLAELQDMLRSSTSAAVPEALGAA